MSGRQVLQRLLLPASRLATANTAHRIVHAPTPCIDVTRTSLLHRYGLASRSLSTCSLFPSSASSLVPGYRNEVNCKVGFTTTNLAHVQQRRTLTKLKKTKIKAYSSYKERFRGMANGEYKRWRSGTRHNAHSKTAKQRRQLRRPSIAPLALAKVMKKLNFMG